MRNHSSLAFKVSWVKRPVSGTQTGVGSESVGAAAAAAINSDPVLLTFGNNVYTTDIRYVLETSKAFLCVNLITTLLHC